MFAAPRTATPATFTNTQVSNLYFRSCRDQYDEVILKNYRNRCGTVRKRVAGTGFTNRMQHIRWGHPTFAEEMLAATPGQTGSIAHYPLPHRSEYVLMAGVTGQVQPTTLILGEQAHATVPPSLKPNSIYTPACHGGCDAGCRARLLRRCPSDLASF
ncbi:hypothetical protein JG687_00018687 [Phytophthora cactorum]|uniref:Uncharacterized protein n=1 Tax=Phytophthora cactorum TaxID=29920 RepID=A0A8T1TM43_9STRA|nr:hypothetical protein JG687_00018687 [Phytophthora cactorum]